MWVHACVRAFVRFRKLLAAELTMANITKALCIDEYTPKLHYWYSGNFMEHYGTFWNFMELYKTLWNFLDFFVTLRKFFALFGTF